MGSDTYATVYLARAPNGKKLALTERKTNNGESFSGKAMREITILRELKHENIVTLLDVPNTKSFSELVFKYEGLKSIINGPALREEVVRNYFKQILSGLAYCHQNNIVHGDLRPENILITENNVIKIAGFGLDGRTTIETDHPTSEDSTLWYRAPEILLGETKYDGKVDIWSAGCILFEMIIRKPLFPGKDADSEICSIFDTLGLPPPEYWPQLFTDSTLQRLYTTGSNDRVAVKLTKEEYANSHLLYKLNISSKGIAAIPKLQPAFLLMVKCLQPNEIMRIDATQALDDEYLASVNCLKEQQAKPLPQGPQSDTSSRDSGYSTNSSTVQTVIDNNNSQEENQTIQKPDKSAMGGLKTTHPPLPPCRKDQMKKQEVQRPDQMVGSNIQNAFHEELNVKLREKTNTLDQQSEKRENSSQNGGQKKAPKLKDVRWKSESADEKPIRGNHTPKVQHEKQTPREKTHTLELILEKHNPIPRMVGKFKRQKLKDTRQWKSECHDEPIPEVPHVRDTEYALPDEASKVLRGESTEYANPEEMNDYATVYLASAPDGKGLALTELKMKDVEGLTGTNMREIAILRGLNHKNIVTLLDVPKTKAFSTLVFEYEDLRTIINEDLGIRTDKVRDFFKQVLCGLEFCHQNNIIHCDLKPENILKRNDDIIKIGGFGLNRQMTDQSDNPSSEDNTLWYKPPEILLGEARYDGKVDIWSAGCILFEMIVQKPLFPGNDTDSEICYIFNRLGLPPPDYWPELFSNSILQRLYPMDINDREAFELTKEEYANSHLLDKLNKLSEEKSTYSGFQLAFPLMVKCLQPNQSMRTDATQALDDEYFGSVKCPKELQDITTLNFVVDDSDMGYSTPQATEYTNTNRAIARAVVATSPTESLVSRISVADSGYSTNLTVERDSMPEEQIPDVQKPDQNAMAGSDTEHAQQREPVEPNGNTENLDPKSDKRPDYSRSLPKRKHPKLIETQRSLSESSLANPITEYAVAGEAIEPGRKTAILDHKSDKRRHFPKHKHPRELMFLPAIPYRIVWPDRKRSTSESSLVNQPTEYEVAGEPVEPAVIKENSSKNVDYEITFSDCDEEAHENLKSTPTLDKYTKIKKLGSGTYATVYLAKTVDGKIVAVKELKMNDEEGFPGNSMREIAILRELNHENIVKLLDVQSAIGCATLVFEYVERELRTIINGNVPLRADKVRDYFRQILRALAYCHQKKVIHRDLKPENILVTKDDVLKLADFGLARQTTIKKDELASEVVTLWYRPPEILLGQTKYDGKIDIWGAGCILFEMIVRKPLFPGRDADSQIRYIFDRLGRPPPDYWPELSSNSTMQRLYPTNSTAGEAVELTKEEYANSHLLDQLTKLSGEKSTYAGFRLGFPMMVKCLQPNESIRIDAVHALEDEYVSTDECLKEIKKDAPYFNFAAENDEDKGYATPQATEYTNMERAIARAVENKTFSADIRPSSRTIHMEDKLPSNPIQQVKLTSGDDSESDDAPLPSRLFLTTPTYNKGSNAHKPTGKTPPLPHRKAQVEKHKAPKQCMMKESNTSVTASSVSNGSTVDSGYATISMTSVPASSVSNGSAVNSDYATISMASVIASSVSNGSAVDSDYATISAPNECMMEESNASNATAQLHYRARSKSRGVGGSNQSAVEGSSMSKVACQIQNKLLRKRLGDIGKAHSIR